jgi:hypothetical protein
MDIELIKRKKKKYGDSFDRIAELWSEGFTGVEYGKEQY